MLKYFNIEEFACKETGENKISVPFVKRLDELRERCGFPFVITSGYRSPEHSIEKKKVKAGTHAQGIAADIFAEGGNKKYIIVANAIKLGFTGIGIADNFVHLDTRDGVPVIWNY